MLNIRNAKFSDIDRIAEIERECFSEAEAASKKSIEYRVHNFGEHIYVGENEEKIIGVVICRPINQRVITDKS